ncbi:glycoside hydrolase family 88/105 protein [Sphingomonas morindae]|uniref:Glycoside hydrolase family 88 protein n=1 Tax=Sphingomonas morindae TaxID=1541170 RepID=A0ABY4X513_9SPHN|nr:glycoside hydrolase family 88 protein [Sphingomonas morindae]USI71927.1 glycoside hydrolase family 88 protein [Sphingomonas morindae]
MMIRSLLLSWLVATPALAAPAPPPPPAAAAPAETAIATAVTLARWQLARLSDQGHVARVTSETRNPRSWEQAVFWIGMTALADAGAPPDIRQAILAMGRAQGFTPGGRLYHADDLAITQAYLWAARHGAGAAALAPTRARLDAILARPPRVGLAFYQPPQGYDATECLTRWCWCDALFMAPPAFLALSRETGDPRYAAYALREFWATTDFLYDPAEHLFYRDSRFFERRDANGRKLFWSRGNGWVFAGLARIITLLPAGSADRRRMEGLFVEMAARLKTLQKPDGYWAPSLLAPEGAPPETSGTAFFTYGLAWGVHAGLLDAADYAPVARRGWAALVRSLRPDGRLGWVQQVSDRPEQVAPDDTQYYGVGGFLLAATAIAALDRSAPRP